MGHSVLFLDPCIIWMHFSDVLSLWLSLLTGMVCCTENFDDDDNNVISNGNNSNYNNNNGDNYYINNCHFFLFR